MPTGGISCVMDQDYVVPDAALLRDAAQGDQDALAAIMAEHEASMIRAAMVILGDRDDVGDAVQTAWQRAWPRLGGLRDTSRLRAWLVAIAANEARQLRRSSKRRQAREQRLWATQPRPPTLEPSVTQREVDLHVALQRLGEDDRELVALRFAGGLTSMEIAVARKTTDAAIRGRVARIVARLREELNHE